MDDRVDQALVLTGRRAAVALFVAAGLAAFLIAADYGLGLYRSTHWVSHRPYALSNITFVYFVAFFVWLIALALCGGPVWLVMHQSGFRKWYHAMLAGFSVPFVVMIMFETEALSGRKSSNWSSYSNGGQQWIDGQITAFGWLMALQSSATFGAIGAALGLVIWHTAYRRP